jgi:hypothetical protein
VLHETAEMAARLRDHPGDMGLVGAVSGLLTKPGLSAWSTLPADNGPAVADLAAEAAAKTATLDSIANYHGPATIATYTVMFDGDDPASVIAIADDPDGHRCVAVSADTELAQRGTTEELIGLPIQVAGTTFTP